MPVKKPVKSLFYNPSMSNAVTRFRHQILLDYIEEVNKGSNEPAIFHITKDGLETTDRYDFFSDTMAPWHTEHSLNFLEANGKVRLFKADPQSSDEIAAIVSELVPVIMPQEDQPASATNSQEARGTTGTKQ